MVTARAEQLVAWCAIPSPLSAEILGRCGFDWVCVDTQHGPIGRDALLGMLQALDSAGVPSLVRVPWNEPSGIMHALDAGAEGVIVPMVNSAEEARAAAGACRYAPVGYRSFGPTRAALTDPGYGPASANRDVVCIVQIETTEALNELDAIADADGIDGLFVGPADLALSLGTPLGDVRDPRFRTAARAVSDAARRRGIIAGMFCGSIDAALAAREDGFDLLAIMSDVRLLRAAGVEALEALRGSRGTPPPVAASSTG